MYGRTLALAIDLGGTKVDAALVDAGGTSSRDGAPGADRGGMPRGTTSRRRCGMSPPGLWTVSLQTIG